MKTMRKLLAMALVLMLALTLVPTALADETNPKGTVQVTGTTTDREYSLYKMFDVEVVNSADAKTKYRYKMTPAWDDFKNACDGYFRVENDYVYWNSDNASAVDGAALAKLASEYVIDKALTTDKSVQVGGAAVELDQGYWLMVPDDGTTCGVFIVTDGKNVVITEKTSAAGLPRVEKLVREDSTDRFGKMNHADYGEVFTYQTTIVAGGNASNYVLHDVLDEHIELVGNGEIKRDGILLSRGVEYSVIPGTETGDGCTFHVVFNHDNMTNLHDGAKLTVTYTARIKPGSDTGTPHKNTTWLTHGKDGTLKTNEDTTESYTYEVAINKVDTDGNKLDGAEFVLMDMAGKYYALDDNRNVQWVDEVDALKVITDVNGYGVFEGVDAESYVLKEVKVPGGYTGAGSTDVSTKGSTEELAGENVTATIVNVLGNALPETGGMGTTLFYLVGGLMVVAAVVLLVTKKRMRAAE